MTTTFASTSTTEPAIPFIDVETLVRVLTDGDESALVDVRDEGVQARDGHILFSVPLPLSRLELRVGTLIRRRNVRIVVTDAGDGDLAARGARRLVELGFTDVSILDGGVAAWAAAGREVYTGSGAYSKAFGEFVEHAYGTPHLSATELKRRLDAGGDLVVLDGRTLAEFENFSIPGAHAIPNAELPYRVHDLLPSAETLVVVNCAGRTRSIIGAQALINAGLSNRVVALENGTMAWLEAGYNLDSGKRRVVAAPGSEGIEKARASVELLTKRFGINWLNTAELAKLEAERDEYTLYIYDVRTQAEFEAGHLPQANWAEGGQLVQGIDRYIGVRNARIVVVDDEVGARAAITASWLIQLGWGEVYALATDTNGTQLRTGADRPPLVALTKAVPTTTTVELKAALDTDKALVLDLDTSLVYSAGHIPGAYFAVRSRLPQGLDQLPPKPLVLTSADGALAAFAAEELTTRLERTITVLAGGTAAWKASGFPIETGETQLLHVADDVWRTPYHAADRLAAFRAYLDWEVELLKQIERDDLVEFKIFPAT